MSLALDLAKDPTPTLKDHYPTRWFKGDPRASEAGKKSKGIPRVKNRGSKNGSRAYTYKGFIIKWNAKEKIWRAIDISTEIKGETYYKVLAEINKYKEEHQDFIETPVEK